MRHHKTFANSSSADIELSKTQLFRIGQTRRFVGRLLGPLLENGLSLMKNKCFNTIGINSSSISNKCSYSTYKFLDHGWLY